MPITPSKTPLPAPIIGKALDERGWFTYPWVQWFSQTVYNNLSNAQPSNTLPLASTVLGSIGTGIFYAREDHRHPSQQHNDLPGRSVASSHPGTAISNTPAGSVSSVTVQDAINELDTEKEPIETRIEVNDTDYTKLRSDNKIIAYTAITANRTVYLPPATKKGQKLSGIDESGDCSITKRIVIVPDGTDTIEGSIYTSFYFAYESARLESNGAGKWTIVYSNIVHTSAGVMVAPSFTDLGTGSITVGDSVCNLFTDPDGYGRIKSFNVAGGTFALTNLTNNYVIADFNSDNPILRVTTNVLEINETTIIPIFTVYRDGTTIHYLDWDALGLALPNKIHQSIVKTQRFRLQPPGLGLTEAATRKILVSSGIVWYGAAKQTCADVDSSSDVSILYYHVAGVWASSVLTAYNNTQYDDGTALQTLAANRYAVNFVYRLVSSSQKYIITVLGTGNYKLDEALASQPPANLPPEILTQCILVGRIIVIKSAASATEIDSAFLNTFISAGITNHNDLLGLQGGTPAEYYHLTSAQHVIATQAATDLIPGYMTAADHTTFAAKVSFPGFTSTATDIKMNGVQSAGSLGTAPKSDHVHPVDTSRQAALGFTPVNKAGDSGIGNLDLASGKVYKVNNVQVVSAQGATVANATGGTVIDVEARAAINALLARVRAHGLIAT